MHINPDQLVSSAVVFLSSDAHLGAASENAPLFGSFRNPSKADIDQGDPNSRYGTFQQGIRQDISGSDR